jgi:GntR family transcriptional repressor for pyruvate dehydrogenase complex
MQIAGTTAARKSPTPALDNGGTIGLVIRPIGLTNAMGAAPKSSFEAVRRNRLYEEVARQIETMIHDQMQPGDMLPPERELAERFAVSRSSIRDAIRRLESIGLVEPRQGSGTVVREVGGEHVASPLASVLRHKQTLVAELIEVRKILEPPLAARAATHASREEIADMEQILRRQAERTTRGEAGIEEDSEFHYAIALAADNGVILKVVDVLMDLLAETRARSLQAAGRPQKSLAAHRRILNAIKRHDPNAAAGAMREHLEVVEGIVLSGALKQ